MQLKNVFAYYKNPNFNHRYTVWLRNLQSEDVSRLLAQVSNRMFSTYHFGVSKFCIRSGARFNKKRNAGFRNHFPYENKNNLEFLGMFGSLATTVSSFMFWYHFRNRQILLLDIQKVAVPRKNVNLRHMFLDWSKQLFWYQTSKIMFRVKAIYSNIRWWH